MISLLELQEAWQKRPKFKNRALGGRRALDGFHYQLAVSLDRFFEAVLKADGQVADLAFEGLSDLTERHGEIIYLVQIKTTLTKETLFSALAELLAIDEFLEEYFGSLREKIRFRVTTRRVRGNTPTKPYALSAADLALDPIAAQRWDVIKHRCLPVEIDSAPEVHLAIRLWNDVARPFILIDACMGRLLDMIPSKAAPSDIAKSLLTLWEGARREKLAPLYLLSAAEFVEITDKRETRRIVHGVRPGIIDLRNGCFMERRSKVVAALAIIRNRWSTSSPELRLSLPIFWISGPSGSGKSVLLLQILKELLATSEVEAINFIESYSHALPRALDNASGASIPIAIAGDDLYSPDNRDPAIWREIGELGASRIFSNRCAIVTCGPAEQLRAFRRECSRHRAFDLVEIPTEPLSLDEQSAYHCWYQERTSSQVSLSRESIFVAVAWIYELYREQQLTPESFALRFETRLEELGIAREGKAALALNLYGLQAPETLFKEHRAELVQLKNEQIWRLANPSTGVLVVDFSIRKSVA
jgi:hypothetical protein